MRWVADYERVWRSRDASGVPRLFTDDARYRTSPFEAFEEWAYWPGKPYSAGSDA